MLNCDTCQVQLLEYAYDLLDDADRQALEAHLAACPACQAALVTARGQQSLLAAAAKLDFSSVSFQPPAIVAPTDGITTAAPVTLPYAARSTPTIQSKPVKWRRWAVAAVLLIGLTGFGAVAASVYLAVQRDLATMAQYEAEQKKAEEEKRDLEQQMLLKKTEGDRRVADLYNAVLEREMKLFVTGPASVQPGAPAEYQIRTTNAKNPPQPVAAQVSVQLSDRGKLIGDAVQAQAVEGKPGIYRVKLPPNLQLDQNSDPILLVSAKRETGTQTEVKEQLSLAAKVYLTHLTTDKPMYQLGETVYFRSLTLDRATLKPADQDLRLHYYITTPLGNMTEIAHGGNGLLKEETGGVVSPVNGPDGKPIKGIGAGVYAIDPNAPGGEYILTLREEQNRFAEQQRKFVVNKYQKPRLNKQVDFNRKTYGPGDEVQAAIKATNNDGIPMGGKSVEATVTVDGKQYDATGKPSDQSINLKLDADGDAGKFTLRFKLPADMEKGQANLNLVFKDGGNTESLSRSIPIVLKKLDVEFYPEGGDLVAGLQNRVYYSVRTTLGKPADLKGRLLEDGKPLDVEVATLSDDKDPGVNQGMGCFVFTPRAGAKYAIQIDTPVGITSKHVLPPVKEDGVVLSVAEGVVGNDGTIKVTVRSTKERDLQIGAYCRGRLLDTVKLEKGKTEATLKANFVQGGVCRITVFEDKAIPGAARHELSPVAERLVYKQPKEQLNVVLHPDKDGYVPGQKVALKLQTVNENEEIVPAIVMLAVVDKSVVTMADEKTARTMPTHFLLTSEVRRAEDLEYADFLLGDQANAKKALDLLLGTQGWRRFAEQDPDQFRKEHKGDAEAERLLVSIGQSAQKDEIDFTDRQAREIDAEYQNKVAELRDEKDAAQQKATAAAAAAPYLASKQKIDDWKNRRDRLYFFGTPVLGLLLMLTALVCLGLGLMREAAKARRYYVAAAGSMAVVIIGFGFWVASIGSQLKMQTASTFNSAPMAQRDAANAKAEERQAFEKLKEENRNGPPAGGAGKGMGAPLAPNAPGAAPFPGAKHDEADLAKGADDGKDAKNFNREMREAKPGENKAKADQKKGAGKAEAAFKDVQEQFDKQPDRRAPRPFAPGGPGGRPEQKQPPAYNPQLPPMVVREYAHQHNVGMNPELRSDWAETLYWHPVLVLPDGKGEVSFELCDSTTTFQVTAFAHTLDGRLGVGTYNLDSRLPFTLQPKLPIEVTSSDKIDVPLTLTNNSGERRKVNVLLKQLDGLALIKGEKDDEFEMPSGDPIRKMYRFQPTIKDGEAILTFEGKTAPFGADSVRNTFRVVPEGFPYVGSHSDMLEGTSTTNVVLPETWVKGSLKCQVNVYPSTLADLQKGLEGLLREPNGCFEQTSTTNYPNVLILGYLKESDQAKPEVEQRARDLLGRGYQKLMSFECTNQGKQKKEGYEWFGGTAPAHEALTAYGLLQFRDMAKVSDVDARMIERTRSYLMEQRDGKGGFKRNARALDTFGRAPENITNAYIIWALTEGSADDDVTTELNELLKQAKVSKDPYFLALVANSLINRSRHDEANALLRTMAGLQKDDGHLDAEKTSITGSGGRDLQIETTALSILAWLKANNPADFSKNVLKSVKWIGQQRGGYGGFGSTQSTILTLKALIAYTKANKKTPEAGELTLYVGDKAAGKLAFPAGASEALTLNFDNVEENLKAGDNKVRVEMTGKNVFPYTLTWSYNTLKPASAEKAPVKLETSLSKEKANEGDGVRLLVKVENVSGQGQGMAVAVIGLPGGLTIPEDLKQLKDYIRLPENGDRPLVSAFEIRGRELVLYWRDLAPGQKIEVPVDLTCRVPGEYSGPASRAYLYYNADLKHWVEPLKVDIAAK